MLENIKDYIFVKNVIPKDICDTMVEDITVQNNWGNHQWHNYEDIPLPYQTKNDHLSFTPELEVSTSFNEQNIILHPYITETLNSYEEYVSDGHSFEDFKVNCGLHFASLVRFNRYTINTSMKAHHDHIHSLFDGERKGIPILSIVGLLNDDYEGGEFLFFKDYEIKLKQGDILIFPSVFIFPHRVGKITKGVRHSFVSWVY